jgi:hypothetical protein
MFIRRIWRAGMRASGRSINIALLTEGENACGGPIYKHCPPDGGRNACGGPIYKIALLTEDENARVGPIYKNCPPDAGRMLYERIAQKGTRSH